METAPSSAVLAADFGSRFSAFMIDAALLFGFQWVIFIVLSRQLQAVGLTSVEPCAPNAVQLCEGPSTALWIVLILFLLVSTVAYHGVFEGRYGATPAKRWLGLVVVDTKDNWPIGLGRGIVRSGVRQTFWLSLFLILDVSPFGISLPAFLFILVPFVGLAMLGLGAFAADGRAVHDHVASTRVVRMDQAPARLAETNSPAADITTSALDSSTVEVRPDSEESV